uniref:Uncharacterized protein n=1 Tax=Arundo donax TaxID=35708 RepID=A0A0A9AYN3_ARUDO
MVAQPTAKVNRVISNSDMFTQKMKQDVVHRRRIKTCTDPHWLDIDTYLSTELHKLIKFAL